MIFSNIDNRTNVDVFRVIHELKNSFAVCSGYLDIIDANSGDDIGRYLSVIRNEIDRSNGMIREFMIGNNNLNMKVIDIRLFLESVCREMELYVNNKSILFEYNILNENIYINGDCNKLKQVFINLIKNSVEACLVGGNIDISSYVLHNYYCIEIIDNGCGMDSNTLEKIGNKFFTTKNDGSGIGVNFCLDIIGKHNGGVEYYSKKDCGTKVIVKLPIIML